MMQAQDLLRLKEIARRTRRLIIESVAEAGSGHPGGSLSAVELVVALYFHKMRHDPKNPKWEDRDRFILSKGHAAPLLYAVLAQAGYFPIEELKTLRKLGSMLQGHPDFRTPGVEYCAGSEGIGLSVGIGLALAAKLDGKGYRTYVLLGDGEMQEGQVWEAAMAAVKYRLDNLTAIVDRNGIQQDGLTENIMPLEPLAAKWKAFNWNVIQIDGYDFEQIIDAYNKAEETLNRPTVIIAHTTKGKGVSFMEWSPQWHGQAPKKEQVSKILEEMGLL
ncbi:transketolase [Candidatus Nitrosocaldus cavascurensis]|uniref:Transketolase n=2 Tax=Candidatus Nitrosocaldaceae TaxID=1968910 RepID=A0A2K5APD2_9ARCH|nr:transketolase [Candidatus Nitrosocaldus cavascurensis]